MKILIVNGPNINLLGKREEVYGKFSYDDLQKHTSVNVPSNVELSWFQSNIEGEIIDKIQEFTQGQWDALIINPAAYSHTSVAIHDALKITTKPNIEVHLTNIHSREDFRQTMLTARASMMIMSGLGIDVYHSAVYALIAKLKRI
jgi:3-dehydroquinate dehydratase-2